MKNLEKIGVRVKSGVMDVKVLRETLKRVVFISNPTSKVRISCCELVCFRGDLWILPTDFIRHVRANKTSDFVMSEAIAYRTKCVAALLGRWGLCTFVDQKINVKEPIQLYKVGVEVLSHNHKDCGIIKKYNFSTILNSIRKYLEGQTYAKRTTRK